MPTPINDLPRQRIVSVDALRGATFILMLFVNCLGDASGIPAGIHHVAAGIDGVEGKIVQYIIDNRDERIVG